MSSITMSHKHIPRDEQVALSKLQQAGISFSDLTRDAFINWVSLALLTPGNQTLIFADSLALNHCQSDPLAMETLKRAELVIPRGRSLKVQLQGLGRQLKGEPHVSRLYDELLVEIEHRQLHICFLSASDKEARTIETLLLARYPKLDFSIEIMGGQYRFSTSELAAKLNSADTRIVLSLLPSPQQERLLSRLNLHLKHQLLVGLGSGFTDALSQMQSLNPGILGTLRGWVRSRRHSIVLRPHHWPSYIARSLFQGREKEQESQINSSLVSSGWRTRQLRTGIAVKAMSFRGKRKLGMIFKRLIDLFGVGAGLLLLSPLLLLVALTIKLTSKGPIFYSQIRVGRFGKRFRMWKFRSMYTDADRRKAELEAQNEMQGGVLFKMKKDPRITPIGRIIRRLSIDELPQLFNVMTGEMSLVGPRPALPQEVEAYPVLARARLEVKPGLTGLWQISGRSDLPFDKQVLLDTAYVHTQSTTNDIKLIAKTIPAVISGKGAY